MTESYRDFASLYDTLTFDVDYKKTADFIESTFKKYGLKPELVLDLACGTGSLTIELKKRGYDMLGADSSLEMLSVARQKEGAEGILFLNQPMEDFELYGTVDAIVCVLDSINYLTDPEALKKTFSLCANYLNPGGLFIFDVNTEYKFSSVLGSQTYVYETDNIFYVWENNYDPENELCELYLNFFTEEQNGLYRRTEEVHMQRFYAHETLQKALQQNGFSLLSCYDDYTQNAPGATTERTVYVVKKSQ